MYCPQNVKNVNYITLRIPDYKGGPGNPSAPLTNFRSSAAMRGAKFHGNTCRDSTTRIRSIQWLAKVCTERRSSYVMSLNCILMRGEITGQIIKVKQ